MIKARKTPDSVVTEVRRTKVKLLERFAFLSVPAEDAERVIAAVDGTRVKGVELRLEAARGA